MAGQHSSVRFVLKRLGYKEIRPVETDEWRCLDEVGDRYGTTNETQIQKPRAGQEFASLTDLESGECIAKARKKRPEGACSKTISSDGTTMDTAHDSDCHELNRLKSHTALPNAHTAAYLLAMAGKEKLKNPDHEALVTSANLAVLKAWDIGLRLTDLDKLTFDGCQREGESRLEIKGQERSISIQVKPRSFSLEEPWDGMYSAATVAG
jgi:hypothetical protein